jgi:hypothetical protein
VLKLGHIGVLSPMYESKHVERGGNVHKSARLWRGPKVPQNFLHLHEQGERILL